jgi:hypothetical protein
LATESPIRSSSLRGNREDDVVHRLHLELVDLPVALDDGEGLGGVVRLERLHREPDPLLDDAPHPQEEVLDDPLLLVQGAARQLDDGLGQVALDVAKDPLDLAADRRLELGVPFGHRVLLPAQPKRPDT